MQNEADQQAAPQGANPQQHIPAPPQGANPQQWNQAAPQGANLQQWNQAAPQGANLQQWNQAAPQGANPQQHRPVASQGANPQQHRPAAPQGANPQQWNQAAPQGANPQQWNQAAPQGANPQQWNQAAPQGANPQQWNQAARQGANPQQWNQAAPQGANPQQWNQAAPQGANPQQWNQAARQGANPQQWNQAAPQGANPQQWNQAAPQGANPQQWNQVAPQGANPQQHKPAAPQGGNPQQWNQDAPQGGNPQQWNQAAPQGANPQQWNQAAPQGANPQQWNQAAPPGANPQQWNQAAPQGGNPQQWNQAAPQGANPQQHRPTAPQGGNPQQWNQAARQGANPQQQHVYYQPYTKEEKEKSTRNFENVLARIWLPIVFIIVMLVGMLWGFVAVVKEGYLSEPVRCLLGVFIAVVLYVLGLSQYRHKRAALGKVLLGGSHGLLIITISVAHLAYEILPIPLAIVCYFIAFSQIIYSSLRWKSQTLITISVISGFLCALLVDLTEINGSLFIISQLAFSILMLILSYKLMYQVAYWFAFVLLHFSLLIAYDEFFVVQESLYVIAVIIQLLCLFAHFLIDKKHTINYMAMQIVAVPSALLWSYTLLGDNYKNSYWIGLGLILLCYLGGSFFFNNKINEAVAEEKSTYRYRHELSLMITSFIALILFVDLVAGSFNSTMVQLIVSLSLIVAIRMKYVVYGILSSLVFVTISIVVMLQKVPHVFSGEMLNWIIILVSLLFIHNQYNSNIVNDSNSDEDVTLPIIRWLSALVGFIFVSMLSLVLSRELELEMQHYFMSAFWTIYAIGAIVLGLLKTWTKPRITGMLLLFVVLMKVIFIDISHVHLGIKAVIFIVLGGVGILISRLMYNAQREDKQNNNINS
ncbi:MAG: DUF2339 domain-containing protein [Candidatus Pristimantibacillus lignocellulolyticus]|uniref:DUF2339 domain-containing protein n=1 Tax=Candidatus Pristimantibacillus lignocellulolyticus TaxID=2994561 RepID=A0A9J6ZFA2_9BACL|nr:MAG: DUF2339 domain-containing protein [Candidatus Pristimantibacillus lignocellulolyticus]